MSWSLPSPLPKVWRNPGGLAWGEIPPGRWLPGLWGCSFGHPSKGRIREASLQMRALKRHHPLEELDKDLDCFQPQNSVIGPWWQEADPIAACWLRHSAERTNILLLQTAVLMPLPAVAPTAHPWRLQPEPFCLSLPQPGASFHTEQPWARRLRS